MPHVVAGFHGHTAWYQYPAIAFRILDLLQQERPFLSTFSKKGKNINTNINPMIKKWAENVNFPHKAKVKKVVIFRQVGLAFGLFRGFWGPS